MLGTALHTGKDLAVSPPWLPEGFAQLQIFENPQLGAHSLSLVSVSARTS